MTEKEIQNAILTKFATRTDMRLWRMNTGAIKVNDRFVKFGIKGQADLSGILPDGVRLEIEVKAEGKKQSKEQKIYQRVIERFGGVYILAYSVEEVEESHFLKGY